MSALHATNEIDNIEMTWCQYAIPKFCGIYYIFMLHLAQDITEQVVLCLTYIGLQLELISMKQNLQFFLSYSKRWDWDSLPIFHLCKRRKRPFRPHN